MTNIIATDIQGQQIDSPVIDLFEITLNDSVTVYFHPGKDDNLADVRFKSKDLNEAGNYAINTYTAIPAVLDGLEIQSDGVISRPTITIANIGTTVLTSNSNFKYKDLVGQTLTKRQTLAKYLVGGSAHDDTQTNPPMELSTVKYKIDRIATESNVAVVFELAVAYDLEGIQLPRRRVVGKYCSWMYQGQTLFGKGGCTVSISGEYEYDDGTNSYTSTLFTDINNNFLVHIDDIDFSQVANWLTGTTYTTSSNYVKTDSGTRAWQCIFEHYSGDGSDNHPSNSRAGSEFWSEIRPYADYVNNGTYALGYLVKASVSVNGKSLKAIFECTLAHTSSSLTEPSLKSAYWKRIDLCGKTLESCKCKFNILPKNSSSTSSLPGGEKDNSQPLPFGGFPATGRF